MEIQEIKLFLKDKEKLNTYINDFVLSSDYLIVLAVVYLLSLLVVYEFYQYADKPLRYLFLMLVMAQLLGSLNEIRKKAKIAEQEKNEKLMQGLFK